MERTLLILSIVLLAVIRQAHSDTGPTCKDGCKGLGDGDYQSCDTCSAYHSCSGGSFTANIPCDMPKGCTKGRGKKKGCDRVWDDSKKKCMPHSDTCNDINECASNPCVHGSCIDHVNSYTCSCDDGWIGINCEKENNACASNPCVRGSCVDQVNSYSCDCGPCYTGINCESDVTTGNCGGSCPGSGSVTLQSCDSCVNYYQCADGVAELTPCPPGLKYDHNKQGCASSSKTCKEIPAEC